MVEQEVLSQITAFIFDFDGVIADSEPAHYEVFRQMFSEQGIAVSWECYRERYLGYDDPSCIRAVYADFDAAITDDQVTAFVLEKNRRFNEHVDTHSLILPGVAALVDDARDQGLAVAICSGAARSEIDLMLERGGLTGRFDPVVSANDITSSKPDPEGYLLALSHLRKKLGTGIEAQQCVVIEDSPFGIQAAKAAGMLCLAVKNSYSEQYLQQADALCEDLEGMTAAGLLGRFNGKGS